VRIRVMCDEVVTAELAKHPGYQPPLPEAEVVKTPSLAAVPITLHGAWTMAPVGREGGNRRGGPGGGGGRRGKREAPPGARRTPESAPPMGDPRAVPQWFPVPPVRFCVAIDANNPHNGRQFPLHRAAGLADLHGIVAQAFGVHPSMISLLRLNDAGSSLVPLAAPEDLMRVWQIADHPASDGFVRVFARAVHVDPHPPGEGVSASIA
jgi:hypothetical protein